MEITDKLKPFSNIAQKTGFGRCGEVEQEYIYRDIYNSLRGRFQPLGLETDGEVHISICSG